MDISNILQSSRSEILYDLLWDEYVKLPGISPSTTVNGLKSMKHLKYHWDHPRPDSDALIFGRAVHCMLFEPRQFADRYTHWETRRAGKKYKEFQEAASQDGKEVLNSYQWWACQECSKSFVSDPDVQHYISSGKPEVSVLSVQGGVQCRGRMDWIDSTAIVDLKTTKSIEPRPFGRDFYAYHYDVKLGLYQKFLHSITGVKKPVVVIVLEKEPPFDVAVLPVPEPVLERGARIGLDIVRKTKYCIESNRWPGSGQDYYLDTPTYHMDDVLEGAEEVA